MCLEIVRCGRLTFEFLEADYTPFFSPNALTTDAGDMGSLVSRTPVASWMALAMAASGGTMGASPTPRIQKGWRGLGTGPR